MILFTYCVSLEKAKPHSGFADRQTVTMSPRVSWNSRAASGDAQKIFVVKRWHHRGARDKGRPHHESDTHGESGNPYDPIPPKVGLETPSAAGLFQSGTGLSRVSSSRKRRAGPFVGYRFAAIASLRPYWRGPSWPDCWPGLLAFGGWNGADCSVQSWNSSATSAVNSERRTNLKCVSLARTLNGFDQLFIAACSCHTGKK